MYATKRKHAPKQPVRRIRHPWLYALPGGELPAHLWVAGRRYDLAHTFKHDFFAATGLYRSNAEKVVAKFNRRSPFFGIPLLWIGRLLGRHEVHLYQQAHDLRGVPRLLAAIDDTGLLHDFVPGRPLGRREAVSDTFFDDLLELLQTLHRRDIAYVDLNKRQNILVGDDGRPYLIDFQISLHLPPVGWRAWRPVRWMLHHFQHGDYYHYLKHKRRLRPDLLTPSEVAVLDRLNLGIRLHRWCTRPLTHLRRQILRLLNAGQASEVAGSDAK